VALRSSTLLAVLGTQLPQTALRCVLTARINARYARSENASLQYSIRLSCCYIFSACETWCFSKNNLCGWVSPFSSKSLLFASGMCTRSSEPRSRRDRDVQNFEFFWMVVIVVQYTYFGSSRCHTHTDYAVAYTAALSHRSSVAAPSSMMMRFNIRRSATSSVSYTRRARFNEADTIHRFMRRRCSKRLRELPKIIFSQSLWAALVFPYRLPVFCTVVTQNMFLTIGYKLH